MDVYSLEREKPEATPVFIGAGMFFGISEGKTGDIWGGTLKGVFRYDGSSVTYFKDKLQKDEWKHSDGMRILLSQN